MGKKIWILLSGKIVGILGLGRIGRRTAELFSSLGANVYGSDLFPDKVWAEKNGITLVSNEELLKVSEILSIHLALDKNNPFVLGENEYQ